MKSASQWHGSQVKVLGKLTTAPTMSKIIILATAFSAISNMRNHTERAVSYLELYRACSEVRGSVHGLDSSVLVPVTLDNEEVIRYH